MVALNYIIGFNKCTGRWPDISGQETSGLGEIRTVETSGQRRDQDKERSGQGDFRTTKY